VLALAAVGCGVSEPAREPPEELGEPAPDFTLPDLQGDSVTLSEFHGKTLIIDFWATWCPPCVFQVPELNKLQAAHQDAGDLMVIGVAVDVEGAEVVGPWVEENDVQYTIVIGHEDVAQEFGAMGFPTLVVVTPEGRIDSLHMGLIEYEELEELVSKFASSRPL
jgi:thiol-disulfide isomerase/thioredoxin